MEKIYNGIVDRFIEENFIDYFLVNEKENEVHKAWVEIELNYFIEDNKEQLNTMNEMELEEVLYREIKKMIFTNEEILALNEDIKIDNYLLKKFQFDFIDNKQIIKDAFLSAKE